MNFLLESGAALIATFSAAVVAMEDAPQTNAKVYLKFQPTRKTAQIYYTFESDASGKLMYTTDEFNIDYGAAIDLLGLSGRYVSEAKTANDGQELAQAFLANDKAWKSFHAFTAQRVGSRVEFKSTQLLDKTSCSAVVTTVVLHDSGALATINTVMQDACGTDASNRTVTVGQRHARAFLIEAGVAPEDLPPVVAEPGLSAENTDHLRNLFTLMRADQSYGELGDVCMQAVIELYPETSPLTELAVLNKLADALANFANAVNMTQERYLTMQDEAHEVLKLATYFTEKK